MKIWLFALCWNDVDRLPFFFRHYDSLVSRYIFFDDGSTDGSPALIGSHPGAEVRRFDRAHADSFVMSELALSDEVWKEARGQADWVIVCDIDELLHHRDLRGYLTRAREQGVTAVPAVGYQMISEDWPAGGFPLTTSVTTGARWSEMDKLSIFNPDAVDEIRFRVGRHAASPEGRIRIPEVDEVLNLHYKYLSFERTLARHREESTGLGPLDLRKGWGAQYTWSREGLREHWESIRASAVDLGPGSVAPPPSGDSVWWRDEHSGMALTGSV